MKCYAKYEGLSVMFNSNVITKVKVTKENLWGKHFFKLDNIVFNTNVPAVDLIS